MLGGEPLLYLPVIVNLPFLCVNKQDFARLQTSFFRDFRRFKVHYAYFRGYYHRIVLCDGIACGAQTVTV